MEVWKTCTTFTTACLKKLKKENIKPTEEEREVSLNWVDPTSAENITEIQIGN